MLPVRLLYPQQQTFKPHVRFRADCVCFTPNRRHSLADVRYRADFVRFTPNNRHSGQGWECLRLTQSGHSQVSSHLSSRKQRLIHPDGFPARPPLSYSAADRSPAS